MGWEQIGLGMGGYDPLASVGIGASPAAGATAGMGLSGLTGLSSAPWYMPQLSEAMGGMAGMGQMMAIPGVLNNMFTYRPEDQSATAGGIQGALQGALAGSMWGWPWGPIAGGTAGLVSGKK